MGATSEDAAHCGEQVRDDARTHAPIQYLTPAIAGAPCCPRARQGEHESEICARTRACALSCSLCSTCCSQVGCQVLRKILLIPHGCSDRVRAVRAAVVLPPARAPRTTRSAAVRREGRDRRGALVPMHAHSHPAGGTITFNIIVNSGRVRRAP